MILDPTLDPPVWRTKDGREIPLPKMADGHLSASIAMVAARVNGARHGTADHVLSLMAFEVLSREVQRRPGLLEKVRTRLLQLADARGDTRGDTARWAVAPGDCAPVAIARFRHLAPSREELN